MKITIVAGARPNFMKIAPIIDAIHLKQSENIPISYRLVHTGQHYDKNLSDTFFEELNIPRPDINLNVKSGSQAEQTAAIMVGFEKELLDNPCDLVLVVGDVTSTMACSIVAKKLCLKVAHVEAGIRSGDLTMPEEINRMVTDSISDYFFTTSSQANENLKKAGIEEDRLFFVGNVMIDTLRKNEPYLSKPPLWDMLNLKTKSYFVMTLHRPSNVDETQQLANLISGICEHSQNLPIIFPVHPRTRKMLEDLNLDFRNLFYTDPMSYLEFNYLVKHALGVVTDSGGITEETTVLNIPCITLRDTTERPETCHLGTNVLVGNNSIKIKKAFYDLFSGSWKTGVIPPLWDGKAAERILNHLIDLYQLR